MAQEPVFRTLAALFESSVTRFADRPYIGTKRSGSWKWHSYAEIATMVEQMRARLVWMGVQRGDMVAVISNNRLECIVVAYACFTLGAAFVPMYEAQSLEDRAYIINDCRPKILFVASTAIRDQMLNAAAGNPELRWISTFDDDGATSPRRDVKEEMTNVPRTMPYGLLAGTHVYSGGLRLPDVPKVPTANVEPRDLACVIYTSGTTGNPKGVMLTHDNIATNIAAIEPLGLISSDDRSLSFLPWAHVFGLSAELQAMTLKGASLAICTDAKSTLLTELTEINPTVICTVPNIFTKAFDGVRAKIAGEKPWVQKLFAAGLKAAGRRYETGSAGIIGGIVLAIAYFLIFRKARAKFGTNLRMAVCGGAGLPKATAHFVEAIGIPTYIGYGMTETSPIVTVNYPGSIKNGSAGRVIEGVTVRIDRDITGHARDGEIVVSGPNVMKGYLNHPDLTAAVIGADGSIRTGDVGYVDDEGFLHITDGRIKDIYKMANGKYVAPEPYENLMRGSDLVSNVVMYGLDREFNVALVVPNLDVLKTRLNGDGKGKSGEELLTDANAQALVLAELQSTMKGNCKGYELVRRVALVSEDFTQQNGLLTPTLKVKRPRVIEKYRSAIESLYS